MVNGIIVELLCTNPSCRYSENKLESRQALVSAVSSGTRTFKVPKSCALCKSPVELIDFHSGTVKVLKKEEEIQ